MQFIGFNFEKISVERKKLAQGKVEISSNINIKTITQEKMEILKENFPLRFDFEFDIKYKPEFAEIIFHGFILAVIDKEKAKEILKSWKNKKIPDDIRIPLFNFILTKCNLKALQFEEEFSLPPHIPLPRIQQDQQQTNYTG